MYPQTLKKSRLLTLLLLLVGLALPVQATEQSSPSKDKIGTGHKTTLSQSVRDHELLIPANGHCLYTSIILGYLLPVVDKPNRFKKRLGGIVGTKKNLPITHKELASHYHDLNYLHSDKGFQQVISGLLKQTGIKAGTWGGPKEIRLMAEKWNLNIQECTPDPDNPKRLIKSDLTQPQTWLTPPEATLYIVQDTPLKEELVDEGNDSSLQHGQISSLETSQHRHHYRLYYTGDLPQPPQKQQKEQNKENNNPQPKDTHQENPKHSSKVIHAKPPLVFPSLSFDNLPGTQCLYLKQPRDLGVLGDQQQDIDRYVKTYFRSAPLQHNDSKPATSKKATALLQVMKDNPTLKLLSHTPLYLRLICTLAKQQGANTLGKCSTPQLYQQIIAQFLCYHRARYHNKPPTDEEQASIFSTYGLELIYLGELAFEGMKKSQAVLPVELQKGLLKKLRLSYPRKSDTAPEHWARIAGLGLLQGYTSSSPRPTTATYFPHLTIQEWLAAHYLVTALYDQQHQDHETAMALINQDKYLPRYQVMLSFMAGLCYQRILDKTDPQGKGLTSFWKLLEAQPHELTGIHHAMMYARCLEACHADTVNLPHNLQIRHKTLIQQVAAWLQAFIDHPFDAKDVNHGNVILPLEVPLQGCPILLRHQLITDHVKPTWPGLSLKGGEEDENTQRWQVRMAKIKALSILPLSHPTAKHLATYLKKALQHKNEHVRGAAFEALASLLKSLSTQQIATFLPPLHNALADKNRPVRGAVFKALLSLLQALPPQEALKWIHNAFGDKHEWVREAAVKALPSLLGALSTKQVGTLLMPFQNTFSDKQWSVRSAAVNLLPKLLGALPPQEALKWIQNAFGNKHEWVVREAAVKALPLLLPALSTKQGATLLIHFQNTFGDNDSYVRSAAVKVFPSLLPALSTKQMALLLKPFQNAFGDKERDVREAAVEALPALLPGLSTKRRASFLKPLHNAFDDKDSYVRGAAVKALPSLLPCLSTQQMGALLKPLQNTFEDWSSNVRLATLYALPSLMCALPPQQMAPFLKPLHNTFGDWSSSVRLTAIEALPSLMCALPPQQMAPFLNILHNAFGDWSSNVRLTAIKVLPSLLHALPQQMAPFLKTLQNAFSDNDREVRQAAVKVLPSLLNALSTKQMDALLIHLRNAFRDDSWPVRLAAIEVLSSLLPSLRPQQMTPFLKPLRNAFGDNDSDVRQAAIYAFPSLLTALPPQDALTWILNALRDNYYRVRQTAHEALKKIADKVWQRGLQDKLQAKLLVPQRKPQPKKTGLWDDVFGTTPPVSVPAPVEDPLKAVLRDWAYLLLRGAPLVCFSRDVQKTLPSYPLLIKALQQQAKTWGWPVHPYTAKISPASSE